MHERDEFALWIEAQGFAAGGEFRVFAPWGGSYPMNGSSSAAVAVTCRRTTPEREPVGFVEVATAALRFGVAVRGVLSCHGSGLRQNLEVCRKWGWEQLWDETEDFHKLGMDARFRPTPFEPGGQPILQPRRRQDAQR